MNQSALKTFAQDARRKLRELVSARLVYWLGPEGGGRPDSAEHRQFDRQIKELEAALQAEGRDRLVERVAYTWFNRLAALRYMDANGYHPFAARVVTPANAQETLPELLQHARAGVLDTEFKAQLAKPAAFEDLLAGRLPVDHPEAHLYRHLLVGACNYYHRLMPFLFEEIGDVTELLLPDDLLTEHSIVDDFREHLTDDACRDVEVLGWLYQFYISERKDQVMARKSAVPTEDIPAVTQLFTPHWIVRYLVENSLGRLWLLNRPQSRLRERMPYYIEGEGELDFLKIAKPQDIRLVDPACGSGHMLTYAFDLLYAIYEEEGYDAPEITSLILRHNLFGVEICDRAAALAAFALCMKARSRDSRFFRRLAKGGEHAPRPQIIELRDVRFAENELRDYIRALGLGDLFDRPLLKVLHQFEEAKNFGSLIQPFLDERAIAFARGAIETKDLGGQLFLRDTHLKVLRVLEQAESLTQRYHVVVANPPYMGGNQMNSVFTEYAKQKYPDSKSDAFAMFIERGLEFVPTGGLSAMVTMQSWMFLGSYEMLRMKLLREQTILSLVHMGNMVMGIAFGTSATVWQKKHRPRLRSHFSYVAYEDLADSNEPKTFPIDNKRLRSCSSESFFKIPTAPIVYWVSEGLRAEFEKGRSLDNFAITRKGMATGDNGRFVRAWFELNFRSIGFAFSREEAKHSGLRWFPYANGGGFRKWFGNDVDVVNWENDGKVLQTEKHETGRIRAVNLNLDFIFRLGVTWTSITSSRQSYRLMPKGSLFSSASNSLFLRGAETPWGLLAFLNSDVAEYISKCLNPTVNANPGDVSRLPLSSKTLSNNAVTQTALDATVIARADWDNFENSWDFSDQPLLRPGLKGPTLEASWRNWEAQSTAAIRRMQELETENNRLFITAYGLEGELQPEVPEEQITLARGDVRRDMAAFLSYAVGCIMGRYSLDRPGIILANAGDTLQEFEEKVGKPLAELSFAPDEDGIVPVLDAEWFEDDIVARIRSFLRATFGDPTLAANLAFIEASLGKVDAKTGKTKPTDLRTYFLRDFYKNHISNERAYGYKKRPIYWMFSSPEGGFQALVYLHRYTRDTLNILLNDYVREFLGKLDARHTQLDAVLRNESARPADRTKAAKERDKVDKVRKEVRAWERDILLPLAQQRIDLDLDDGVKVNYLKFKGAVVPIPGLEKEEEE